MKILIGVILFSIFLFLSGIHFYWGMGGKWGASGAIPSKVKGQNVLNPKMLDCILVGIGLLCFGIFILIKSNILYINLPAWLLNNGLLAISFIFFARAIGEFKYVGFFKKIRDTNFGRLDTKYFSPLCLIIGILSIIMLLLK
ncbi:MAG: DUF3995 domain-containing protein [Ferruginibacter sp.]